MRGCLGVLVVMLLACPVRAQGALDKPAFTASAAELLAAAKAAREDSDVVVLREDHEITVDDQGLTRTRLRVVVSVRTQAGADEWRSVGTNWNPSYQDRPLVRARVIDPAGTSNDVDVANVSDKPRDSAGDIRHDIQLPLPKLAPGSVIEQEVTTVDRASIPGGVAHHALLGNDAPTLATHVTVSAPAKRSVHVAGENVGKLQPKIAKAAARQTWRFDLGKLPSRPNYDPMTPPDVLTYTAVAVSTAASWNAVARDYAAAVDKVIADAPLTFPAKLTKTATPEALRTITHWVNGMVALNDVYFYDTSMVPAAPSDVLKRGGDSKDKATLLVALLRQAGLRADLALVQQGPGVDVDPRIPALNVFDHAIVRVLLDGKPMWIETGHAFVPVGQLLSSSQGRRALVVSKDTTDLVITPATVARDSVIREQRTYTLAEGGYASVVEVVREGGVFEPDERDWLHGTAATEVRKTLADYVGNEFAEAELRDYKFTLPQDLTTPFELTISAREAHRAFTGRDQIDVWLFPYDAFDRLPSLLTRSSSGDAPPRTSDMLLTRPHQHVVETRLVIPPGFTMPAPAPRKQRALGSMTFVETQRIEGRDLIVTYELDTGKARLSPAEVKAVQAAVQALDKEGAEHVVIENTGAALLLAGKVQGAIAEFERMAKLHPKEAIHHSELARAYLHVGAGAAARRAAKRAVAVDPKDADAHVVLGWILTHDELGRRYVGNFDRAGAIAAFEKARTLHPKHVGASKELAMLLERDAAGFRFEPGADFAGAAKAYRVAYELDRDTEVGLALVRVLLWSKRHAEAVELAQTLPQSDIRDTLIVAGVGAQQGGAEALRKAATLAASGTPRTTLLNAAAGTLFLMRSYDAMRVLFREAKTMPPGSVQAKLLEDVKRFEQPFKPNKTPADAVLELVLVQLLPERTTAVFWDNRVRDDVRAASLTGMTTLAKNRVSMTRGLVEDVARSLGGVTIEGDAKAWRAELDQGRGKAFVYLAADRGTPKVIGADKALAGVGRHVLKLLAAKDETTALRVLDWIDKDLSASKASQAFSSVWGTNLPRTRQAMELAAAVLAGPSAGAETETVLERCGATTTMGQFACDYALREVLRIQMRWADLEQHAQTWSGRANQSALPKVTRAQALARLGRHDEADKIIDDILASAPTESIALITRVEIAILRGQLADAVKRMEATTQASPSGQQQNDLAWLKLAAGSDLAGARTIAQKALELIPGSSNILHTLASIEAEVGELGGAWKHGLESMEAAQEQLPSSATLYLHGRILEQLGLRDEAIATYQNVKVTHAESPYPDSHALAVARLKVLGAKK